MNSDKDGVAVKPVAWLWELIDSQGWPRRHVALGRPTLTHYVRNVEPLFKHPPVAAAPNPPTEGGDTHKIIEAADCIGVRGATWALTIEWPDGTETVEHVSDHGARALGYMPDDGEG
jgi:hypothetical protein